MIKNLETNEIASNVVSKIKICLDYIEYFMLFLMRKTIILYVCFRDIYRLNVHCKCKIFEKK